MLFGGTACSLFWKLYPLFLVSRMFFHTILMQVEGIFFMLRYLETPSP